MLVSAIMNNLSGLFDTVNEQVGSIATEVGTTPANFSPGVFTMIQSISETVILPIAGIFLTFIACYPYVWGGSSPSTSFDCSGFVCWVINHCGNGWNYGRLDAETLRRQLSIIPASAAKPGDIIFFQGTYDTYGASHVGIYVGGGMMIHCGNPISYANINTSYWQAHFYCYGRLP